jgi:hypothetical protein
MLAPCDCPGYTVYCNRLMFLQQYVATPDRIWGGHTTEIPTLHLLKECPMNGFLQTRHSPNIIDRFTASRGGFHD